MAKGLFENTVDEIKSRCDIVDVIGRVVPLKKMGSNYKGVCPFHNEKTPSFVVSETKQIFTCFGCGATGDVIAFIERYYNLEFQDAIEKLASEYGIQLTKKDSLSEAKKTALYDINREAAAFFYRSFRTKDNRAYEYMKKRGLSDETLKTFGIGYADEKWDSLYQHFLKKGVDIDSLVKVGLLSYSKGKYFDKFRDRVIFPIINVRGKVIGFGGRAIGDGMPKYLNSSESAVFQKKNNLYGLNLTRQEISKEQTAVLVEGYMDVISLYQHGIRNVSASLGTALTENQAILLKRYGKRVILSYDADGAGKAATLRALDILHREGLKAKALHVTDGKDPDEFIKKNGKEAFLKLVERALPFAEYKLSDLRTGSDLSSPDGKVAYLQGVAKILRELSPIEADIYIKNVSKETKISEEAIRLEIFGNNRMERGSHYKKGLAQYQSTTVTKHDQVSSISMLEKNFIKLMIVQGSYITRMKPYEDVFATPVSRKIYEAIRSLHEVSNETDVDLKELEENLEPDEALTLKKIMENVCLADQEEEVFLDCVDLVIHEKILRREKEIIDILALLDEEDSGMSDSERNEHNIEGLMKELMEIQKQKSDGRRNRRD